MPRYENELFCGFLYLTQFNDDNQVIKEADDDAEGPENDLRWGQIFL